MYSPCFSCFYRNHGRCCVLVRTGVGIDPRDWNPPVCGAGCRRASIPCSLWATSFRYLYYPMFFKQCFRNMCVGRAAWPPACAAGMAVSCRCGEESAFGDLLGDEKDADADREQREGEHDNPEQEKRAAGLHGAGRFGDIALPENVERERADAEADADPEY